jgi:protein-L-isoaspartate(D-aspartate) O-methyltransferase
MTPSEKNRFNMIEQQIRTWNVLDEQILDLFRTMKREDFVSKEYKSLAFADIEIPITSSASMLPPKIEARILTSLNANINMKALHIGTGSGFFSGLLSSQVSQLLTIDIDLNLLKRAREIHQFYNIKNIEYIHENGFKGIFIHAPFDLIVFTASHLIEPPGLREQLNIGGKLLLFEGNQNVQQVKLISKISKTEFDSKVLFEAVIPSLLETWEPNKFTF